MIQWNLTTLCNSFYGKMVYGRLPGFFSPISIATVADPSGCFHSNVFVPAWALEEVAEG
jgi:hypothetical protein